MPHWKKLAEQRDEIQKTLSCRTAVKWLHEMGYKSCDVCKGVYKDGYERTDIVQYSPKKFFQAVKASKDSMVQWQLIETEGDKTLQMIYPTNLARGTRPIVPVVHDESTRNANDGRLKIWIKDDNIPSKKKMHRKDIMVSDFPTPEGRLRVPEIGGQEPISDYSTFDEGCNQYWLVV
ncbi:hypothetical protein HOY80DRAFT_892189 [Tuber brumale]|nr:hypothetical protein HOY80DRAFT_892189 [Tuber brumale]